MALFAISVFAQEKIDQTAAEATQVLVEKYQLNKTQEAKMLKIQQRRLNNIAQVAALENTDIEKYFQKRSTNERQTRSSIKLMLNKEQREILSKDQMELRKKRASISARMQKEGASAIDIKRALLPFE